MITCTSCGHQAEQGERFCMGCGSPLASAPPAASPAPAMPRAGSTQSLPLMPQPTSSLPPMQQSMPPMAPMPPNPVYPPAAAPRRSSAGTVVAVAFAALVIALGAFFGTRWYQDRQGTQAAAEQEVVVTVTATAAARSADAASQPTAQAAAPAPATTSYPDVPTYGGKQCLRDGTGPYAAVGTENASTSCPFAVNVRQAYLQSGLNGSNGNVSAFSPTTGKSYTMSCSGSQPVLCTGGVAARVLIYGGTLR